jgi:protein-L-isoaspartate(D-aspartate) O-methyltransferase
LALQFCFAILVLSVKKSNLCFQILYIVILNQNLKIMLRIWIVLIFSFLGVSVFGQTEETFSKRRDEMVKSQILSRGVSHKETVKALSIVRRHDFVPVSLRASAYDDRPLPIGYGQTISQPFIVAYMTELSKPAKGMKVLEIGAGSGYQAAVLAEIVDTVYTIEIVPQLGNSAQHILSRLGYKNVVLKVADGYFGWKEKGPFDIIMVTAAADHIPPPLIDQLKEGGRMIIPVGSPFLVQQLMLVEKNKGKISTRSLMPVRFVPFTRGNE